MDADVEANGTFQRSTVSITGFPWLTKGMKVVLNTSGGSITGNFTIEQSAEDVNIYKGKTVTFTFFLRSNKTSNVRATINDGITQTRHELDTNSGDGTWRQYWITKEISTNANELTCYFIVSDGSAGQISINPNEYIEVAGMRLYVGSEHLDPVYAEFSEELKRCQRYFYGAVNGEMAFVGGYSIYRLNGVPRLTWDGGGGFFNSPRAIIQITDEGATGSSTIQLPVQMRASVTPTVYLFDTANTTSGGFGASQKVTVTDTAGSGTNNVAVTNVDGFSGFVINMSQAGTVNGRLDCFFFVSNEL